MPHLIYPHGNAKLSTTQSKFGGASLYLDFSTNTQISFDGSGDLALGSGDYTVDFWYYAVDLTGSYYYQVFWSYYGASPGCKLEVWNGQVIFSDFASDRINSSPTTLSSGTWYHIALTRAGGSTRLFINGTQVGSTYTDSNNYGTAANLPWVGGDHDGTQLVYGYIDEFRILKGTAAWTANFTPPTAPYSVPPSVGLTADATVQTAATQWQGTAVLAGAGALAVDGLPQVIDTSERFAGVGSVAVPANLRLVAQGTLAGAGALVADATKQGATTQWQGSAEFDGIVALAAKSRYFSSPGIVFGQGLTGQSAGWQGQTLRQRFEPDAINFVAPGTISVRFEFAPGTSGSLDAAYIGEAAASGDPYDFDGGQVQLKFGGLNSKAVSGAQTVSSDLMTFSYDPNKALIVSAAFSGAQVNLMGYGG